MVQQEIKTSPWQRILAVAIAIILVGSTLAIYIGLVLGNNNNSNSSSVTAEEEARYSELMSEYQSEVSAQAEQLSAVYFDEFIQYKSEVKAFNAADANAADLSYRDLKIGDGEEVTDGFTDYSAYYIGWLADETVFDSSFDDASSPTALVNPLAGGEMIEGWNLGIVGMKLGGVREITIPSELAYKDEESDVIPANSPLKFIVMLISSIEEIEPSDELYELYYKIYYNYE